MMSVAIAFIAFLMLATSKIHEIVAVMITARVLQGMSVGFSMASATIYVSFLVKLYIGLPTFIAKKSFFCAGNELVTNL